MNTGFNQVFGLEQSCGFGNGFSYNSDPASNSLVLFYDLGDVASYPGSGATVTDLKGNSSATLYNSPTFSSGYLSFNGSNQYLLTNTSLNAVVPTNVTTIMMWVRPSDNGVLLSERGAGGLESGWHSSQMEMVGGTMKFGMWNGASISSFSSSVSTPLNVWYHFAIVYDGTNLNGYVNGVAAGSVTFVRQRPGAGGAELHYAVAGPDTTNIGDGTYTNMRLGQLRVYSAALSAAEVTAYFDSTKSTYGV